MNHFLIAALFRLIKCIIIKFRFKLISIFEKNVKKKNLLAKKIFFPKTSKV